MLTPFSRKLRLILATVACAALPAAAAQSASASIWTPIASGTTSDITAIYYRGGDNFWFGTGNGEIFKRTGGTFTRVSNTPGYAINDIEFSPSGAVGLAVGSAGKVLRTTDGTHWNNVTLPNLSSTLPNKCNVTAAPGDLHSVRFAGDGRAFIFGPGAQIARSPSGASNAATVGMGWVDSNKNVNSCYVPDQIDDAFFVTEDVGYLVSTNFGIVYFTSNHLMSSAAVKTATAGNGFETLRRVAGDANNPNRMWSVEPGAGGNSYWRGTQDGWASNSAWDLKNSDAMRDDGKLYDIAASGGTVLTAGDGGAVQTSIDGQNFYVNGADGAIATADWRAVDLASASDGAIGGRNGALAVTTQANVIPDIIAPTATIGGPTSATAGQPVTFTANVADNAGGSGVNPASLGWTSDGTPGGSGASYTVTFPSAGFYTVRLSFADNAGNSDTASTSIFVSAPSDGTTLDTRPAPTFSLSGKGNGASAKVSGGKVQVVVRGKIKVPAGVNTKAACTGTVLLTIKKGKTLLTARNAKLGKTCAFSKTISLSKSKVGSAKKLAITVRFQGNTLLKPKTQNLTAKIRR